MQAIQLQGQVFLAIELSTLVEKIENKSRLFERQSPWQATQQVCNAVRKMIELLQKEGTTNEEFRESSRTLLKAKKDTENNWHQLIPGFAKRERQVLYALTWCAWAAIHSAKPEMMETAISEIKAANSCLK